MCHLRLSNKHENPFSMPRIAGVFEVGLVGFWQYKGSPSHLLFFSS